MGEFVVDAPIYEDKQMEETAASNPALQVSVSFGRFENDSLSWEKWSAFSPNKYLEEVEKCATPGSVAQKKAYFEAHYKKIAARKAELLALEKQAEKDSLRSEDQNGQDLSDNTCRIDAESNMSNSQGSTERVKQETNYIDEIRRTHMNNWEENIAVSIDYQGSSCNGEDKPVESRSDSSQIDKPAEVVCEKEESPIIEAEDVKEFSHSVDNEIGKASDVEAKHVKLDHSRESKKVISANRESNSTKTKKKQVLPTSKAPRIPSPRNSRPTLTPTKTLASPSSAKRGNSPSLSGRKSSSISGENKTGTNNYLHMSLNLGPINPDPAPHTTLRKSFIMEKMGDKDIVKRAFKTFQNNFNQLKASGEYNSLMKKQVPSRGTEPRVPTSVALRKDNGRPAKVDSMDKRSGHGNVVRPTLGMKSDIRSEKGKEKTGDISNAKEAERTRLQLKLKGEKEAEIKRLKNFKATPLPAFYRGQKVSKSHPEKGDVKTVNHR